MAVDERRGHGRDDVYFKHEEKGYNSHLSGSISSRPKPVLPNPGFMFFLIGKSSPFMAQQFRLVMQFTQICLW